MVASDIIFLSGIPICPSLEHPGSIPDTKFLKTEMTVSRTKRFVFVDTKQNISKKQVFIFGSIIASGCLSGSFLITLYIEYLHNPAFHSFVQSRGIFL